MASEENRLEVRGDPMSSSQHGCHRVRPRRWLRPLRRLPEPGNGPDHWRKLVTPLQQHAASDGEVSPAALAGVGCPVLLPAGDHDVDRPAEVARVVGDFMAKADDGVRPAPAAAPADQPTATPTGQPTAALAGQPTAIPTGQES